MAKVIVIANQKGGVGKTTTTFNVADSLVALGKKVLLIDFDSSANLSSCFDMEEEDSVDLEIADILDDVMEVEDLPDASEYIHHANGIDFIASSSRLSSMEVKLLVEAGTDTVLAKVVDSLRDSYDYILIDTNPSLGILTTNALAASDEVLITVCPEIFSLDGLMGLLTSIRKIKSRLNGKLEISGICMTRCDFRTTLYKDAKEDLVEFCADRVRLFQSEIPQTVTVGNSQRYRKSISKYSQSSKAGIAYQNLAKELIAL